jgi:hypothetical protein
LPQRESSRKLRQIKILERFDSAVSEAHGAARAIAVNAPSRARKRLRARPFRYVQIHRPPVMFGTSAKRPAASLAAAAAASGMCGTNRRRRCIGYASAGAATSSRMLAVRQPAFIACH